MMFMGSFRVWEHPLCNGSGQIGVGICRGCNGTGTWIIAVKCDDCKASGED